MRFAFTDDQLAFRDAVARVLDERDRAEAWSALAGMGVAGLLIDESLGGMAMSLLDLEPILEESGRAALAAPVVDTAAIAPSVLGAVGAGGTALLGRIASGECTVSVGLDPTRPVELADVMLLAGPEGLVAVERAAGEEEGEQLAAVDPQRRLISRESLSGSGALLGPLDGAALADARRVAAVASAAFLVGLADEMLGMTVAYVADRKQFGVPVGSFQAVKHHLADALLANEFAKPVVRHAAAVLCGVATDGAHPLAGEPVVAASMAKACASDAAMGVARTALQCHGAIGYTVEYELHLYLKRTWALAEAWGSAAWHRELIAQHVLDTDNARLVVPTPPKP